MLWSPVLSVAADESGQQGLAGFVQYAVARSEWTLGEAVRNQLRREALAQAARAPVGVVARCHSRRPEGPGRGSSGADVSGFPSPPAACAAPAGNDTMCLAPSSLRAT